MSSDFEKSSLFHSKGKYSRVHDVDNSGDHYGVHVEELDGTIIHSNNMPSLAQSYKNTNNSGRIKSGQLSKGNTSVDGGWVTKQSLGADSVLK